MYMFACVCDALISPVLTCPVGHYITIMVIAYFISDLFKTQVDVRTVSLTSLD